MGDLPGLDDYSLGPLAVYFSMLMHLLWETTDREINISNRIIGFISFQFLIDGYMQTKMLVVQQVNVCSHFTFKYTIVYVS